MTKSKTINKFRCAACGEMHEVTVERCPNFNKHCKCSCHYGIGGNTPCPVCLRNANCDRSAIVKPIYLPKEADHSTLYAIIIIAMILVSNLFFYLQGRVSGFMRGYAMYTACVGPLEHAIVRLSVKNGASVVVKTWQPRGGIQ